MPLLLSFESSVRRNESFSGTSLAIQRPQDTTDRPGSSRNFYKSIERTTQTPLVGFALMLLACMYEVGWGDLCSEVRGGDLWLFSPSHNRAYSASVIHNRDILEGREKDTERRKKERREMKGRRR